MAAPNSEVPKAGSSSSQPEVVYLKYGGQVSVSPTHVCLGKNSFVVVVFSVVLSNLATGVGMVSLNGVPTPNLHHYVSGERS